MRLIDADALIESLSINPEDCPGCPEPEWLEELADVLALAPAVDAIDRQAAIDALERSKKIYFDRQVIIGAMKDIVRNLPSAQPEIIRCRECRFWYTGDGYNHENGAQCALTHMWVSPGDYCSYAKRRQVNDEKQIR